MALKEATKARFEARRQAIARDALKVMRGYYSEYYTLPSYAELATRMRYDAKSWAYECVRRLLESGYVQKLPGGRLAPTDRFFDPQDGSLCARK